MADGGVAVHADPRASDLKFGAVAFFGAATAHDGNWQIAENLATSTLSGGIRAAGCGTAAIARHPQEKFLLVTFRPETGPRISVARLRFVIRCPCGSRRE